MSPGPFYAALAALFVADAVRGHRRLMPFLVPYALSSLVAEALVEQGEAWAVMGSEQLAALELALGSVLLPYAGFVVVLRARAPGSRLPWALGAAACAAALAIVASPGPAGATLRATVLACCYLVCGALTAVTLALLSRQALRRPAAADVALVLFAALDFIVGSLMLGEAALEPRVRAELWEQVQVANAAVFLAAAVVHALPVWRLSWGGWRSPSFSWRS